MNPEIKKQLQELHEATLLVRHAFGGRALGDLDPAGAQILVPLALSAGRTVTELAKELNFNHSSVSNALRSLNQQKFVKLKRSKIDSRKVLYEMTFAGGRRTAELAVNASRA